MDQKMIFWRYGEFYDSVRKIAAGSVWKDITVRAAGLSRAELQRAYNEMKRIKFSGTVIEFYCSISLEFILIIMRQILKNESFFNELMRFREFYRDDVANAIRLVGKNAELFLSIVNQAGYPMTMDELFAGYGNYIATVVPKGKQVIKP